MLSNSYLIKSYLRNNFNSTVKHCENRLFQLLTNAKNLHLSFPEISKSWQIWHFCKFLMVNHWDWIQAKWNLKLL